MFVNILLHICRHHELNVFVLKIVFFINPSNLVFQRVNREMQEQTSVVQESFVFTPSSRSLTE